MWHRLCRITCLDLSNEIGVGQRGSGGVGVCVGCGDHWLSCELSASSFRTVSVRGWRPRLPWGSVSSWLLRPWEEPEKPWALGTAASALPAGGGLISKLTLVPRGSNQQMFHHHSGVTEKERVTPEGRKSLQKSILKAEGKEEAGEGEKKYLWSLTRCCICITYTCVL